MGQRAFVSLCAVFVLGGFALSRARAAERDPDLDRGIHMVEAGQWKQALVPLGGVTHRLSKDKKRTPEAAEAFLYSGLAYVGLGDTVAAISQFAEALRRDPQIAIPSAHLSSAAQDAFSVAGREAVAPAAALGPKSKSKALFIGGGAVLVGAGIAVAAGAGSSSPASNGIPPMFTVTGATGAPQPVLVSAVPPSSSTVDFSAAGLTLTFVVHDLASLPARVQILTDMTGPAGACIAGHSDVAVVDKSAASLPFVVAGWTLSCPSGFTTTSMTVRLQDPDTNVPIAVTTYSGGYVFTGFKL